MTEFEEFAEALLDQISVETDEEKEIAELTSRINDDSTISFSSSVSTEIWSKSASANFS